MLDDGAKGRDAIPHFPVDFGDSVIEGVDLLQMKTEQAPMVPGHTTSQHRSPPQALGGLLTRPGGTTTAFEVGPHVLGRNCPLVLLMALIGVLFWPTPREDEEAFESNGSDEASPSLYRH